MNDAQKENHEFYHFDEFKFYQMLKYRYKTVHFMRFLILLFSISNILRVLRILTDI